MAEIKQINVGSATYDIHAAVADTAETADIANSAVNDGDDNEITDTYMTKVNPIGSGSFSMNRAEGEAGDYSSTLGYQCTASSDYAHAEGYATTATGGSSHTEGRLTVATGVSSHVEGYYTTASGENAHAEGYRTLASGGNAHAEGRGGNYSGKYSVVLSNSSDDTYTIIRSDLPGSDYIALLGFVIGYNNEYRRVDSITGGNLLTFDSPFSESLSNASCTAFLSGALGDNSHVEGYRTTAEESESHAEGILTFAYGSAAHVEGNRSKAIGYGAHAEGGYTQAMATNAHAEGLHTEATGLNSHAEGYYTNAIGSGSHAEGCGTMAEYPYVHVQGTYNQHDSEGIFAHIIGNGTEDNPSNAHTVDWDGNAWYAGGLTLSGNQLRIGGATLTYDSSTDVLKLSF